MTGRKLSFAAGSTVPPAIRVMVVDDHAMVREGLLALLQRQNAISVVGSVATGGEAVLGARHWGPDVIIMDLLLPDLNGIDAARRILGEFPQIRIIALSARETPKHVCRALRAGVRGYVVKAAAGSELIQAIHEVSAGKQFISPCITAKFTEGSLDMSISDSLYESLSDRERQVLRGIVAGSSSAEIAKHLSLSRKTIDTYRSRLMVKLGVSNRSALIRLAIENELIFP
jgi:DNA-binding NarL/FixJ family response regulator